MDDVKYWEIPYSFATFQRKYPEEIDKAICEFFSDIHTEYAVPVIEDQSGMIINDQITIIIRYKIVPKRYL